MKIEFIRENIIRWVDTCTTWEHFDAIIMAVDNCLLSRSKEFTADEIDEADHAIGCAVARRLKDLQLWPDDHKETTETFCRNLISGTDSLNFSNFNQIIGGL